MPCLSDGARSSAETKINACLLPVAFGEVWGQALVHTQTVLLVLAEVLAHKRQVWVARRAGLRLTHPGGDYFFRVSSVQNIKVVTAPVFSPWESIYLYYKIRDVKLGSGPIV